MLYITTLSLRETLENKHLSGLVWKAPWEEIDGQKDAVMKGRLLRRGHTFQMIAIALLPEERKKSSIILSDFLIAGGRLDCPRTEDRCSVIKQWLTQGLAV